MARPSFLSIDGPLLDGDQQTIDRLLIEMENTGVVYYGEWVAPSHRRTGFNNLIFRANMARLTFLFPALLALSITPAAAAGALESCLPDAPETWSVRFGPWVPDLQSGGGVPGFTITEFSIENLPSDPVHRQMLETLNPPLAACTVTFVVRTDGTK